MERVKIFPQKSLLSSFSLMEVILAMTVLVVGLVFVLRLFPVGLSASREAIAEKYSAESVDHFLHIYALMLKSSAAAWEKYGTNLPTSKPGAAESNWEAWESISSEHTIYSYGAPDNYSLWRVEQRAPGTDAADFMAVFRIWIDESIQVWDYDSTSSSWVSSYIMPATALAINLETSWPAGIPYARRSKGSYRLEIFKP